MKNNVSEVKSMPWKKYTYTHAYVRTNTQA